MGRVGSPSTSFFENARVNIRWKHRCHWKNRRRWKHRRRWKYRRRWKHRRRWKDRRRWKHRENLRENMEEPIPVNTRVNTRENTRGPALHRLARSTTTNAPTTTWSPCCGLTPIFVIRATPTRRSFHVSCSGSILEPKLEPRERSCTGELHSCTMALVEQHFGTVIAITPSTAKPS